MPTTVQLHSELQQTVAAFNLHFLFFNEHVCVFCVQAVCVQMQIGQSYD